MRVSSQTRRPRAPAGRSARAGLAITLASTTIAASYALQRLGAWALGEPAVGTALALEYTPYYWRLALAVLHGLVVGLGAGLALDEDRSARVLQWTSVLIPLVVLPLALAMVAVP